MKAFLLSILAIPFLISPDVPSIHPLKSEAEITSGFGMRMHPVLREKRLHRGVDFRAQVGTPVYATADGTVTTAEFDESYGKYIVLEHGDGYETLYSSLDAFDVEVGAQVTGGQPIGRTGQSGMSTNPHLHYEVRRSGVPVDPASYFTGG